MLKPIVRHDHLGLRILCQQGLRRFNALFCYKYGSIRRTLDEERLVTCVLRSAAGQHLAAVTRAAPVAARHHACLQAACLQVFNQGHDHGRFASATCHHIADHDHAHRQAPGLLNAFPELPAPHGDGQAVQQGDGPKQPRQQAAMIPRLRQPGHALTALPPVPLTAWQM